MNTETQDFNTRTNWATSIAATLSNDGLERALLFASRFTPRGNEARAEEWRTALIAEKHGRR
jgi:hypothetical protein